MVRAKNQAALAFQFVNGAVDGTVGTLFIHQNMLYNTENEEFLPVARRIGPMGNSQILLINEISD
ncbi:MAG: hypothetical protein IBX40_11980, partial [Methanosarcinales archaeon]|nr:hypothetical protein [Methanosarcinales archaeon]